MSDADIPARLDDDTLELRFEADVSDSYERDDERDHMSASSIKQFKRCPLAYWFRYVSNLDGTEPPGPHLALGSRVHESIEDVLAQNRAPVDRRELLEGELVTAYEAKSQYQVPDDMLETGLDCVQTAAKWLSKVEPDIRGIEKKVEYTVDRPDVDANMLGYMDLVTQSGIVDWKTGSIRDNTNEKERIQGAVYMAGYFDEYGEAPDSIQFVYLDEGKVRSVDPSDDVWEFAMTWAARLLDARENEEYPANPGSHCRVMCPYEGFCPHGPAGAGDVPYSEY